MFALLKAWPWRVAAILTLAAMLVGADKPPWRARRRPDVRPNKLAALRVQPQDWPAEPVSPSQVRPAQLAGALNDLCGWMPRSRPGRYAGWILEAAQEFGVDPFLVGALIYRESRCRPAKEELGGLGLTLLAPRMYQGHFKGRSYHYWVRQAGSWVERLKSFKLGLHRERMLHAESNIHLSAGLLAVWREQHDSVDAAFDQVPHRHYVSHWVWGDKIRSARAEDRILTDRRRLLEYYGQVAPPAPISRLGLKLGSPLDGAPRVVSSGLGSRRGGGRKHRGVDVESELGEPLRAIADGRVVFAGVDLPGNHHNEILALDELNDYDRDALGRGGRYMCIRHERHDAEPITSCYMHMETVEVAAGSQVRLGQRIGTVGRTGMARSSPHLHIEMHTQHKLLDPLELLGGHLIGEPVEWEE